MIKLDPCDEPGCVSSGRGGPAPGMPLGQPRDHTPDPSSIDNNSSHGLVYIGSECVLTGCTPGHRDCVANSDTARTHPASTRGRYIEKEKERIQVCL